MKSSSDGDADAKMHTFIHSVETLKRCVVTVEKKPYYTICLKGKKKNNSLMNLIWNFKASDIICLYITSWPSSSVRRKKEALINSQGRTENIS